MASLVALPACVAGLARVDALAASVDRSGAPNASGSPYKSWDGMLVRNVPVGTPLHII